MQHICHCAWFWLLCRFCTCCSVALMKKYQHYTTQYTPLLVIMSQKFLSLKQNKSHSGKFKAWNSLSWGHQKFVTDTMKRLVKLCQEPRFSVFQEYLTSPLTHSRTSDVTLHCISTRKVGLDHQVSTLDSLVSRLDNQESTLDYQVSKGETLNKRNQEK